jgi:hypothetical protein
MVHETSRNRQSAGKAAPTSNPAVKYGQEPVGSSTFCKLFCKFRTPMVSNIPVRRTGGFTTSAHSWASTKAYRDAAGQACRDVDERSSFCRLPDGPVDITACSRSDRPSIRHSVSSFPRLEASGKYGMELPETGTARPSTGRRENCPLEAVPMAAYKKTLRNSGHIWPFLMKVVFCLSLR